MDKINRVAVLLVLLMCFISGDLLVAQSKPNVLLIMTDQQTADALSCAGNP